VLKTLLRIFRSPGDIGPAPAAPRSARRSPWNAVTISRGPQACQVARSCGTRRWLSSQAPRLPMPGCDAKNCECRYRHFQDRRAKPRRQMDRDFIGRYFNGPEQRLGPRGRRESDAQEFQ
jgi:hypothetical protein